MAKKVRYEYPVRNPALQIPICISGELMVALGTPEATLAAMAYAAKFLSASIRDGESSTIFECGGIEILATIEEEDNDWHILLESCSVEAFSRNENTCQLHR